MNLANKHLKGTSQNTKVKAFIEEQSIEHPCNLKRCNFIVKILKQGKKRLQPELGPHHKNVLHLPNLAAIEAKLDYTPLQFPTISRIVAQANCTPLQLPTTSRITTSHNIKNHSASRTSNLTLCLVLRWQKVIL